MIFVDAPVQTDCALLTALRNAAKREMSAAEIRAQRVSWIMGFVSERSGVTREMVEADVGRNP